MGSAAHRLHPTPPLKRLSPYSNVRPSTPSRRWEVPYATGASVGALAPGVVSFYTAPFNALVSEKFFALGEVSGAS